MKILIKILLCLLFIFSWQGAKAQNYINLEPDTFYYPFKNGIQMIEILVTKDHTNNPYHKNIYIFRNKSGKILKVYNQGKTIIDFTELSPVEENKITEDFLLYQYPTIKYTNPKNNKSTILFAYQNHLGLLGLFDESGKIIIPAKFLYFSIDDNIVSMLLNNFIRHKHNFNSEVYYLNLNNADRTATNFFKRIDIHIQSEGKDFLILDSDSHTYIIDKKTFKILFASNYRVRKEYNRSLDRNEVYIEFNYKSEKIRIYLLQNGAMDMINIKNN